MESGSAYSASTLLAYIRLPHFVPIVAVLAGTVGLALVIGGDALSAGLVARMVLAMLGGQIVVGVVNELVDAPVDAATKPDKPIPAGLVTGRGAMAMGTCGLIVMVVVGSTLGWKSLALLAAGTAIGVAYSLWFKATPFAWLPYLAALPLLVVWVAVTLDAWDPVLLSLYVVGIPATLAIHLAQALPDVEADRAAGLDTLTTRLGERWSFLLCWASVGVATAAAVVIVTRADVDSRWLLALAGAGVGAIVVDGFLIRRNQRAGVLAVFPCVIAAAGALALACVAAITS